MYAANFADVTAFQSIRRKDYSVPSSSSFPIRHPPLSTYLSFLSFLYGYFKKFNFSLYCAPDPNPYDPLVFRPPRLGSGLVIYLNSPDPPPDPDLDPDPFTQHAKKCRKSVYLRFCDILITLRLLYGK
jgi:hypothetical protein